MKKLIALVVAGVLACVTGGLAQADLAELHPTATLVSAGEDDKTNIALSFDLSSLRAGAGRRIDDAVLRLSLNAEDCSGECEARIHAILEAWTQQGMAEAEAAAAVDYDREAPIARRLINPAGRNRIGRETASVRLDVRELVDGWEREMLQNNGVMLVVQGLSESALEALLASIILEVRYGFIVN